MTASIPAKLRLDNAANIYPASMSKHYCSLYRMKVTLTENIDKAGGPGTAEYAHRAIEAWCAGKH